MRVLIFLNKYVIIWAAERRVNERKQNAGQEAQALLWQSLLSVPSGFRQAQQAHIEEAEQGKGAESLGAGGTGAHQLNFKAPMLK